MSTERSNRFYIHTFGCQMNQADSAIMAALLVEDGYVPAESEGEAGIILLNTCAVRENAVERIEHYLQHLLGMKRKQKDLILGVAGCIPQYQREEMFSMSPAIDFLAGPDTYRSLPLLISQARSGKRASSLEFNPAETYEGIDPRRQGLITAFVPVMRGCNNMCAYCVVPFTRGRERSHTMSSVLDEVRKVAASGYREITLLGQNVNSYSAPDRDMDFAGLLEAVSRLTPELRIRFTTSHPKDISESLVRTIARRPNICNHIHLPVQSGSSRVLGLMNRGHTIEQYREKIALIRSVIPDVSLSTDLIAGFCGEDEADHQLTLKLLSDIRFDAAYMFFYSTRPGTLAARTLEDDVPEAVKKRRLQEIIDLQNDISGELLQQSIGSVVEVLAESESRRSATQLMGRTDTNRAVVFDRKGYQPGDLVSVLITSATSATMTGTPD
ncbi:tRNA (N6-isopentenyl adenosine(37)-C2)-methylthiotransferase MiaB [Chlorobium sp. KB01]|uniref:tRNA (N6-isopentenyl adenosine(37)-C2)-methylthiotransferase MiaB n=1 Tax=Chlorobium sp. KB01 TaxID=1917528 RepID=UPI000976F956|nr:tRNA (N6-isopentenyl adenosine(37)-C2)-methylthiotransferase MiaB [Chlorobium sp. KB01]